MLRRNIPKRRPVNPGAESRERAWPAEAGSLELAAGSQPGGGKAAWGHSQLEHRRVLEFGRDGVGTLLLQSYSIF